MLNKDDAEAKSLAQSWTIQNITGKRAMDVKVVGVLKFTEFHYFVDSNDVVLRRWAIWFGDVNDIGCESYVRCQHQ